VASDGKSGPAGGPIPDPGEAPASRYALAAGFTLDAAVTTFQPVVLDKPKTFARADLSMAIRGVVVNAQKANQVGKDLYFVTPEAARAGALEGVSEGYEALLLPHVDRDGTPYLSVTRMRTRDGVELESYGSAVKVFRRMAETWAKGEWVAGGYRIIEPPPARHARRAAVARGIALHRRLDRVGVQGEDHRRAGPRCPPPAARRDLTWWTSCAVHRRKRRRTLQPGEPRWTGCPTPRSGSPTRSSARSAIRNAPGACRPSNCAPAGN
jgi:hypothetical protein